MARKKRASMREGPLADLFRSTEESVAPEEVKVTANGAGTAPVEVAVEEPVQETPGPRARPGAHARARPGADAGPRS